MIVINKNEGPKIDYDLNGYRLTLDDEMTIRLDRYERDWPIHLDICRNRDGFLVMSTDTSLYYVAEIDIPAAQYEEAEGEDGETVRTKLPLDTDNVTLTLWAVA